MLQLGNKDLAGLRITTGESGRAGRTHQDLIASFNRLHRLYGMAAQERELHMQEVLQKPIEALDEEERKLLLYLTEN